jgi:hypothetical protein
MNEEKQSSNKHINFGFLTAVSVTIAALVAITSISIQSEPALAQLAQPGTQNENTTGTMTNENTTGTMMNSTG